MRFKSLVCTLMMLAASMASAGEMTLMGTVVDRWDSTFTTQLPWTTLPDGRIAPAQPGFYEVDVTFTAVKNPTTEKGWLNTAFSAATSGDPGLTLTLDTWAPHNPNVDVNGAPPPGATTPHYGTNTDAGTPGDLQSIVVSLASASLPAAHAFDKRNEAGTAGAHTEVGFPTLMGSFFVSWDGTGTSDLVLNNHQFIFSLLDGTSGPEQQGPATSIVGFGSDILPNTPPTVVDATIPGLGHPAPVALGEVLTHQFTAIDAEQASGDLAWSGFALASFTPAPAFPGGVNNSAPATFDPLTQMFTWNTLGAARGLYDFVVTATDAGELSDQGHLVIEITAIPEPATFALLGLAMFGLVGCTRRR